MTKYQMLRAASNPTNLSDESMNGFIVKDIVDFIFNNFTNQNGQASESVTIITSDGSAYRCGTIAAVATCTQLVAELAGDYSEVSLQVSQGKSHKGNKLVQLVLL